MSRRRRHRGDGEGAFGTMRAGERNIILAGFKATGKSVVGRRLAERLGYAFVDLDEVIEAEVGMPVPLFFGERGETEFRELEVRMVQRVAGGNRSVIATGGGTIVNPANLRV
jgi:shikimate kinase